MRYRWQLTTTQRLVNGRAELFWAFNITLVNLCDIDLCRAFEEISPELIPNPKMVNLLLSQARYRSLILSEDIHSCTRKDWRSRCVPHRTALHLCRGVVFTLKGFVAQIETYIPYLEHTHVFTPIEVHHVFKH